MSKKNNQKRIGALTLCKYFEAIVTKPPPKDTFMGIARLDLGEDTKVKVLLTPCNPLSPLKKGQHIGAIMAGFYVENDKKIIPWVIQQPKF